MLTIIIGIGLILLSCAMAKRRIGKWWMTFWILMIGMFSIIFGMLAPINGYNEYVVREEIQLSSIGKNEENNTNIYIIELENGDKVYQSVNLDNKEKLKVYDKSLKLEIIEQEECDKPRLVYYFRPIKTSIFSLALWTLGEKYVFYIPKGSVIK